MESNHNYLCFFSPLYSGCVTRRHKSALTRKDNYQVFSVNSKFLRLALNTFYRHNVGTFENIIYQLWCTRNKMYYVGRRFFFPPWLGPRTQKLANYSPKFWVLRVLKERSGTVSWSSQYFRKSQKKSQIEESVSWLRFGFVITFMWSKCAELAVTFYPYMQPKWNTPL